MDLEVIKIPPPIPLSVKSKNKQVATHEVIDVDNNEDSTDTMILDEVVDIRSKGKAIKSSSGVCPVIKAEDFVAKSLGLINKVKPPKHSIQGSKNISNLDCNLASSDELFYTNYINDFMDAGKYAMLQEHFDGVELPAGEDTSIPWFENMTIEVPDGLEASIPWFENISESKKKTSHGTISSTTNANDSLPFLWLQDPGHINMNAASVSNSSSLTPDDPLSHSPGVANLSSPSLFSQILQSQNSATSQTISSIQDLPVVHLPDLTNGNNASHHIEMILSHAIMSPVDTPNHTVVAEPSSPFWLPVVTPEQFFNKHSIYSSFPDLVHGAYITPEEVADIRNQKNVDEEAILSKLRLFKQFDTVEDFSDHHYASSGASTKQPLKNWSKKIQEEWKILEKDLPDTIFVRVYESRMDLLRAVIIGVEGTPYHDGLFFFDVFFPASYPKEPPHVYYHSGGLRLNPNLYDCGKVCLSLLNTWSGKKNERWIPGMSTMLQVLVSIQALILNQKPYFNEPGWERLSGTPKGELMSRQYNEETFILSLKTMIYSMRRPPRHFEDFVVGHFYTRAQDILLACKAYMDGAQVGCPVKGGIQDVEEGEKSCSPKFKVSMAGCVNMLVKEFTVLGVKDCEKFLVAPESRNNGVDSMPMAAANMN
ncbi:hypothetical protein ES319_A11G301500v1 [Gossypium barbadense]|uniref:E2 ubiquitin-conjugating enzyme n=1 Tax=Gossypium barbadense TaxID=3634 RepID=A0A5J5TYE3_GOSBA|nr:hypothetical protein ES319_A11G301500v1 [Gossypium barbadense]KAB2059420.1 hypothetical protein ES319_A11G301500v1 [Gossypium barbadense]